MTTSLIITTSTDPFTRGLDYLYGVRSLALAPEMVDRVDDRVDRVDICIWISTHIAAVNRQLNAHLQACHACFHSWERPSMQIFAAPLAPAFGLDALCNFQTTPFSILIDVGRVMPADWLLVVAHEYGHAHAGTPGHHPQFARSLAHLCLGLELAPPPDQPGMSDRLRFHPGYPPTHDPLAFWREDWEMGDRRWQHQG